MRAYWKQSSRFTNRAIVAIASHLAINHTYK